ncbi:hypothetical protein [Gryllotalpicola ginsengisoli]|uniref:hypothetical protein n=1 Tax=Gryllotalpicola ginsengisoli TaxID=444608 RepID=UPI0003B47772|nr:hypothetical protein [Gryllotalpicola ginsengisoli]
MTTHDQSQSAARSARAALAARAVTGRETKAELVELIRNLQHELLRAESELIGTTEAETHLLERVAELEQTELGRALVRIGELEDEKEALKHLLAAEHRDHARQIEEYRKALDEQLERVHGSRTWRVGSAVLSVPQAMRRRIGR